MNFFTTGLIANLISNPEEMIKKIVVLIFVPLMALMLLFALPGNTALSVPSILIEGRELDEKQSEIIQYYMQSPALADLDNKEWVEETKESYSWCDSIEVRYDFNLYWQTVIAIDSVLLNQDFSKADLDSIVNLALRFAERKSWTETYIERVKKTRRVKEADGSYSTETYYVEEIKTKAIIQVKTRSLEDVLKDLKFNDLDKEITLNIYKTICDLDIEGNFNLIDSNLTLDDLKQYPPGSSKLPYFSQFDKRWGNLSYGSSNIKNSGCGPTSLAMVIAGLTGRTDINPKQMADWSVKNGHRAEGAGSYWSLMTQGGKAYGLDVTAVSRKNPNAVMQALSEGNPVIVSMGKGHFTNGGHFIVLTGVTPDGKITVHDPASQKRSNQAWDLSIIMSESSKNGGANGSPFWIFKN